MTLRWSAAALFLTVACGGSSEDHTEDVVFRVGASAGLAEMIPGPELEGSSAAAADLIYEYAAQHVSGMRADGRIVRLTRLAGSPHSAQVIAAAARYQGLESARVTTADQVELTFTDADTAARAAEYQDVGLDLGPFRLAPVDSPGVRLVRRADSAGENGIDVIEISRVSHADEWRKLMARELDVMPFALSLYRDQFAGMHSVRLVDVPATTTAALHFNVRDHALADPGVRRLIAAGLRREAIARIACGDSSAASDNPYYGDVSTSLTVPERLSLLVLRDDSPMVLAAEVLRHQLDRLGIALDVEAVAVGDLITRAATGRVQLFLIPQPKGDRRFSRFVSPTADAPPMTGFADPAYDAAVAAGELATAQAILDREVPVTLLYEERAFAAIDERFCGDVKPSATSWRWMADLYPCDETAEESPP